MPRMVAPIQLDIGAGGVTPAMLPFHIVLPGGDIQAAITLAAADGRHIWIHPGTYTILATLTVPAGAAVYIWGCGRDTIIALPALVGFSPMFQLAAGVTEFELHDLFLDGNGWLDTVIETQGALTHLHLDHIGVDAASFVGPNFNMIDQTGVLGITDVIIDYCELYGGLDLRASRANIRDSNLQALNGGHDFQNSAVIYAARNIWDGGVALGATVVVAGATALFHDEGSTYTGDTAISMGGGEMNLRGCNIYAGTGWTIYQDGGSLRISDCRVLNGNAQVCIHADSGAEYLGVHNCELSNQFDNTGVAYGIDIDDGEAEISGNNFIDCGVVTDVPAEITGNRFDLPATNTTPAIEIRANNSAITGNNIRTCFHATADAIELFDNDNNVVVGNQLQGFNVNEDPGAAGNIIGHNRVGA